MSDETRIINTHGQLVAAVEAKLLPKKHALAISYTPHARHTAHHGVSVWSPLFKTDPKSAWYNHSRAVFGSDREQGVVTAKAWIAKTYGFTGPWLRNAFQDWIPEIIQKTFPIKRRKKTP